MTYQLGHSRMFLTHRREYSMNKYTLDELAYLKQVAFFRLDMCKEMIAIGIPKEKADYIVFTDSIRKADLIQWWTDYADTDLGAIMETYLNHMLSKRK